MKLYSWVVATSNLKPPVRVVGFSGPSLLNAIYVEVIRPSFVGTTDDSASAVVEVNFWIIARFVGSSLHSLAVEYGNPP